MSSKDRDAVKFWFEQPAVTLPGAVVLTGSFRIHETVVQEFLDRLENWILTEAEKLAL